MKKTTILAAAATLATLSFSNSASAGGVLIARDGLLGLVGNPIVAPGLGVLGVVTAIAPLGRIGYGGNCNYLMNWASPYNPNLVATCVLSQTTTVLNPSCTWLGDYIPTAVLAGNGFSFCQGFDLLGFPVPVSIIATSTGCNLVGVACFDGFFTVPIAI